MGVFIDTSAFYATLNARDRYHQAAAEAWKRLDDQGEVPVTSNYVLLETIALIGRRLGLQAVRDFQTYFAPIIQVHWVDEALHGRAIAALLTAAERDLSLVDCVSFEIMRQFGVETAFAFDNRFAEQGFRCIPLGGTS